jgi:hypothetical protein
MKQKESYDSIEGFAPGKSFNILVAEDEEFSRHNLIKCLTFCQFENLAVENGKQAV